ncbi:MAG: hypothetical protein HY757_05610 [Nitrospirae bacterium]|nr:hypothetical protein [Nitrospirota bacterium]
MKKIKIYCEDLEKTIDEDGCYDAKGSTICQACSKKPVRKKVKWDYKDKKKLTGKPTSASII